MCVHLAHTPTSVGRFSDPCCIMWVLSVRVQAESELKDTKLQLQLLRDDYEAILVDLHNTKRRLSSQRKLLQAATRPTHAGHHNTPAAATAAPAVASSAAAAAVAIGAAAMPAAAVAPRRNVLAQYLFAPPPPPPQPQVPPALHAHAPPQPPPQPPAQPPPPSHHRPPHHQPQPAAPASASPAPPSAKQTQPTSHQHPHAQAQARCANSAPRPCSQAPLLLPHSRRSSTGPGALVPTPMAPQPQPALSQRQPVARPKSLAHLQPWRSIPVNGARVMDAAPSSAMLFVSQQSHFAGRAYPMVGPAFGFSQVRVCCHSQQTRHSLLSPNQLSRCAPSGRSAWWTLDQTTQLRHECTARRYET